MASLKFPSIQGMVVLKSSLGLIATAEILSDKIFCGIPFGGLEKEIYDEVPAVFISNMMGLQIILQGEDKEQNEFLLEVGSQFTTYEEPFPVRLEHYLAELLKAKLSSVNEIEVIEWTYPED